jgi:hypothetical protein
MPTNTHENYSRKEIPQSGTDRSFGLVFTVVLAIVGLWPLRHGGGARWWALALSAVFLLAALLIPSLLNPLNRLWFRFGLLLSRVTNPIVLAIMFFLLFTPIGIACRLLRKNLLGLRPDPDRESYWIPREAPLSPETMRNQF